jgi:hypothetical protein
VETPRGFLIIPLQISISVKEVKVFTASESSKGKPAALLIIAGVGALSILAGEEAVPMNVDFEPFKWKNRLLLVFAPDSSHPLLQSLQGDISTRKHEVDDRDLVVFEILGVGTSKRDGTRLDPHTAASLRKQFDISPKAFSLILVGKDGRVKLRRNDPVKLEEIFRLIDSMPMRQEEMSQKGRSF